MSVDTVTAGALDGAPQGEAVIRERVAWPRLLIVAAGLAASVLFIVAGLRYDLALYADGSIFSYSVAVQDAWAFHWHNISGRLSVYVLCYLPAEAYVALTADARGGMDIYASLFFGSQLAGLAATYVADRSKDRIIFRYACLSAACLCPLVFGYPTEMWMAHALFWPALAICHYAHGGARGFAVVLAALAALVFTHEGAVVFAAAILATLLLRGMRDIAFLRGAIAFALVMLLWACVKVALPPDANFSSVLMSVALNCIDPASLICAVVLLLLGTLAGYGGMYFGLSRLMPDSAHLLAAAIVVAGISAFWLWFDQALHADYRYYLRTALLIATPLLGALAAFRAVDMESRLGLPLPFLPHIRAVLARGLMTPATACALLLVLLVHVVETTKFVRAWTGYRTEIQSLAMGPQSNPVLGDVRFVSATRVGSDLDRLAWPSTTAYLSVLLAPDFRPLRLVVDPRANYYWVSCDTAAANEARDLAIPTESRRLIRLHACRHR